MYITPYCKASSDFSLSSGQHSRLQPNQILFPRGVFVLGVPLTLQWTPLHPSPLPQVSSHCPLGPSFRKPVPNLHIWVPCWVCALPSHWELILGLRSPCDDYLCPSLECKPLKLPPVPIRTRSHLSHEEMTGKQPGLGRGGPARCHGHELPSLPS